MYQNGKRNKEYQDIILDNTHIPLFKFFVKYFIFTVYKRLFRNPIFLERQYLIKIPPASFSGGGGWK